MMQSIPVTMNGSYKKKDSLEDASKFIIASHLADIIWDRNPIV